MAKYLLDSDVIIEFLRGKERSIELIKKLHLEDCPAVSAISLAEVELGMKEHEMEKTLNFLDALRILPVDKVIARQAAGLIRQNRRRGVTVDFNDTLIAATALMYNLTLVTYNLKHFPFKYLSLYKFF